MPRRHIVILPDVSGSIEPSALEQAFKAIDELAGSLHRGDKITIIPILGDAQAEASGRIIRFEVPMERRAYDADLHQFRKRLGASLAQMRADAQDHPGTKTDILGSIELAEQEFQATAQESKRFLLILSDFIEEDGDLDFRTDTRLRTKRSAELLAAEIAKAKAVNLHGVQTYLGFLRSSEFSKLSRAKRAGILVFWKEYFGLSATKVTFSADGLGLLILHSVADGDIQ